MTKKTFTSKPPPSYQETPSEPDTLPPPPYTPQETTPLIPGSASYAGSSYAPSGPSYSGASYTASSHITDNSSTAGDSLPPDLPHRNRTLRHAFRELRRDYLLATYHRALDVVAARGWRRPTLHWPDFTRSQRSSECGEEVRQGRRRERVRVWVRGVRGHGQVSEKKMRRRRVILCCNLLLWVLIALGIAVFIRGRWATGGLQWPAPPEKETIRVAVVGAGPAGVSAAYTLSTAYKSKDINLEIVLFEQKADIGGRMVFDHAFPQERLGRKVYAEDIASGQIGSNIFRTRAREIGLVYNAAKEHTSNEVGFFDGRDIVAKLTRPMSELSWGTWLSLVLRYRFSLWNAKKLPKGTMQNFNKLLECKSTFERVSDMIKPAGIEGAVELGAVARLSRNGVGGDYIHQVLEPQVLRQTGQRVTELSDLAISMALEREDQYPAGFRRSFETILMGFVRQSRAELRLGTKVTSITTDHDADEKRSWILKLQETGHSELMSESFDHIIVAGPNSSLLKHYHQQEVYYRPLFLTFLVSSHELSKQYFGASDGLPSQVLPIQSDDLPSELEGIHEMSYVSDIFGPDIKTDAVRKLYRVLSARSLSKEKILAFGGDAVLEIHEEEIENAYPLTWPRSGKFGEFKVRDGLWTTGEVEAIGSSVDLAWVAGENVGRLVGKNLRPSLRKKWTPVRHPSKEGIMK